MLALNLYDLNKGKVFHPNPLLNPKAWNQDDFTFYNKDVDRILKWKLGQLYNNGEPKIKTSKVFILNQEWLLEEIDLEGVDVPEDIQSILDTLKEEGKKYIMKAVKMKLYDDLSYSIAGSLLSGNTQVEELQDVSDLHGLFSLPFNRFFTEAKQLITTGQYTTQDLDNFIIKSTSKYYYNEKLPTPYLGLLAREHFLSADNKAFEPRLWQLYFLYHEPKHKLNLAASHRQAGKTALSALLVFQFLMRNERSDILYLTESQEKIHQPLQYIERGIKKYTNAGMFSVNKNDATIKCNVTGNTLKFMSIGARSGIKSFSSPIIMMDEGGFFPSEIFYTIMPIISKPGHKLYVFSTINWESKEKNTDWFPNLIKQAELGLSDYFDADEIFAIRVTIDQNETITDSEKKMYSMIKRDDPARYLADYYGIISGDDALFDKQKLISPLSADQYKNKNVIQAIIGWDPAMKFDASGIVVSYVINENDKTILVPVHEETLKGLDYYGQIDKIKEIINLQKIKNIPVSIIMDVTGLGEPVYQMAVKETQEPIYKILYTAGNKINYDRLNNTYRVPKQELVDGVITSYTEGKVKVPFDLKELITQLDTYRKVQNKYEAITGHDDVVESFMNTVFLFKNKVEKGLNLFKTDKQGNKSLKLIRNTTVQNRFNKFLY